MKIGILAIVTAVGAACTNTRVVVYNAHGRVMSNTTIHLTEKVDDLDSLARAIDQATTTHFLGTIEIGSNSIEVASKNARSFRVDWKEAEGSRSTDVKTALSVGRRNRIVLNEQPDGDAKVDHKLVSIGDDPIAP